MNARRTTIVVVCASVAALVGADVVHDLSTTEVVALGRQAVSVAAEDDARSAAVSVSTEQAPPIERPLVVDGVVIDDLDSDGVADVGEPRTLPADETGDGRTESTYVDKEGDGMWERIERDLDHSGRPEVVRYDDDLDQRFERYELDDDEDGVVDEWGFDTDRNGTYDTFESEDAEHSGGRRVAVDVDEDGLVDDEFLMGHRQACDARAGEDCRTRSMNDESGGGCWYFSGHTAAGGVFVSSSGPCGQGVTDRSRAACTSAFRRWLSGLDPSASPAMPPHPCGQARPERAAP